MFDCLSHPAIHPHPRCRRVHYACVGVYNCRQDDGEIWDSIVIIFIWVVVDFFIIRVVNPVASDLNQEWAEVGSLMVKSKLAVGLCCHFWGVGYLKKQTWCFARAQKKPFLPHVYCANYLWQKCVWLLSITKQATPIFIENTNTYYN